MSDKPEFTPGAMRAARALHVLTCDEGLIDNEPWPEACRVCNTSFADQAEIITRETHDKEMVATLEATLKAADAYEHFMDDGQDFCGICGVEGAFDSDGPAHRSWCPVPQVESAIAKAKGEGA